MRAGTTRFGRTTYRQESIPKAQDALNITMPAAQGASDQAWQAEGKRSQYR